VVSELLNLFIDNRERIKEINQYHQWYKEMILSVDIRR
jgi:hypothetical protein